MVGGYSDAGNGVSEPPETKVRSRDVYSIWLEHWVGVGTQVERLGLYLAERLEGLGRQCMATPLLPFIPEAAAHTYHPTLHPLTPAQLEKGFSEQDLSSLPWYHSGPSL